MRFGFCSWLPDFGEGEKAISYTQSDLPLSSLFQTDSPFLLKLRPYSFERRLCRSVRFISEPTCRTRSGLCGDSFVFKEICLYSITDGERGSGVRARNRLRGQPRGITAEKGSLERRCYKAFQVLLGAEADRYARPRRDDCFPLPN